MREVGIFPAGLICILLFRKSSVAAEEETADMERRYWQLSVAKTARCKQDDVCR